MAEEMGRVQIPSVLESVLRYCLKDASGRMSEGQASVTPFSALAVKDKLFMEEHPGSQPADCFDSVRRTVQNAVGADAYGFCYDGYVDTDEGRKDCLIAEGGVPGDPHGHAIGLLYEQDDQGAFKFFDEPVYVGTTLNYMLHAVKPSAEKPEEPEKPEASEESEKPEASEE